MLVALGWSLRLNWKSLLLCLVGFSFFLRLIIPSPRLPIRSVRMPLHNAKWRREVIWCSGGKGGARPARAVQQAGCDGSGGRSECAPRRNSTPLSHQPHPRSNAAQRSVAHRVAVASVGVFSRVTLVIAALICASAAFDPLPPPSAAAATASSPSSSSPLAANMSDENQHGPGADDGKAPEAQGASEHLNLKVKSQDGNEVYFKVRAMAKRDAWPRGMAFDCSGGSCVATLADA